MRVDAFYFVCLATKYAISFNGWSYKIDVPEKNREMNADLHVSAKIPGGRLIYLTNPAKLCLHRKKSLQSKPARIYNLIKSSYFVINRRRRFGESAYFIRVIKARSDARTSLATRYRSRIDFYSFPDPK